MRMLGFHDGPARAAERRSFAEGMAPTPDVMTQIYGAAGSVPNVLDVQHTIERSATVAGNRDRLRLFEELKIPPLPGGRRFRAPLLFLALNWYALRDRF